MIGRDSKSKSNKWWEGRGCGRAKARAKAKHSQAPGWRPATNVHKRRRAGGRDFTGFAGASSRRLPLYVSPTASDSSASQRAAPRRTGHGFD